MARLVESVGKSGNAHARQLLAEAHVRGVVAEHLVRRVTGAMAAGRMPPSAGSLLKLFGSTNVMRHFEIGLEVGGGDSLAWPAEAASPARRAAEVTLARQGASLGGGSNEIQRNIISERLLGLPREYAADREVPYREVKRTGDRSG